MAITDYDIIIVGAGPAGVSTWLNLHKRDPKLAQRTLVIDKAKFPREKLCGGGLSELAITQLEKLGITLSITKLSIQSTYFLLNDKKYTGSESLIHFVVYRKEFDQLLVDHAIRKGMIFHQAEHFLNQSSNYTSLGVETNRQKYITKVLVGADGTLSKVRSSMKYAKKIKISRTLEVFSSVQNCYDYEFMEQCVTFDFNYVKKGLQGYVWHFPCIIDGQPMMNHGIFDSTIHRDIPLAKLKELFSRDLQLRNINIDCSKLQGGSISHFNPEYLISSPHILLAGDAAGIDPFMGGGIHYALAYGEIAADTIVDAVQKNDFNFDLYITNILENRIGQELKDLVFFAKNAYNSNIQALDNILSRFK